MSPTSNSSTEARNGSAYSASQCDSAPYQSQTNFSSRTTSVTHQARYPVGNPYSTSRNGRPVRNNPIDTNQSQYQNGDYQPASEPHPASTYEAAPLEAAPFEPHSDVQYANKQYFDPNYYPAAGTVYAQYPVYDSELSIDGDQAGPTAMAHNPNASPDQTQSGTEQNPTNGIYYGRDQQNDFTANQYYSPPTNWWTAENSPEERIRLGLPRWESEEHRLAYEHSQQSHQGR